MLGWLLESKLWNKIKLCLWWHRDGSLFSMDNVNEIHRATLSYDSIVNTIITVTCIDKLNKQGGPMWQNYPTTKKKPLAPAQKYAMGYRVIKNNRVKQCIVFQQCHTPAYLTVMCSLAVWGAVLSQSVTVDLWATLLHTPCSEERRCPTSGCKGLEEENCSSVIISCSCCAISSMADYKMWPSETGKVVRLTNWSLTMQSTIVHTAYASRAVLSALPDGSWSNSPENMHQLDQEIDSEQGFLPPVPVQELTVGHSAHAVELASTAQ